MKRMAVAALAAVLVGYVVSVGAAPSERSAGISGGKVKIGVLTDMKGPYSALAGEGSVVAAKLALEDATAEAVTSGRQPLPVELISGDSQNNPDATGKLVKGWFEVEGVDMVTDLVATNIAIVGVDAAKAAHRMAIVVGAASTLLTNDKCSPYSLHWMYDTHALSVGTGQSVVKQGGDTWFFLTADYAFGHNLERDTSEVVLRNKGKLRGTARHPFPGNQDFAPMLTQAADSGAKVLALANAGADTVRSIRQAGQMGVTKKMTVVPLLTFITDIHELGLEATQGMLVTEGFYWDRNEQTRAWAQRYFARTQKMPSMVHAGVYSAVLHYLKAVNAAGTDDVAQVSRKMRELEVSDPVVGSGRVRQDGRMVHDMLLLRVKKPAESKGPWDYYQVSAVIPGDQAFQPLAQSTCPYVDKPDHTAAGNQ